MGILIFILNSVLIGAGLAMDAFSVSLANGLNEPTMSRRRTSMIAGIFALFQCAMPLIGWVCVSTVARHFSLFERCIPWIALVLLSFIGGKMLIEGIRHRCDCGEESEHKAVAFGALLLQGVATSIDALSVGFTIADYNFVKALLSCLIIAAITFVICTVGILIGRRFGTCLAGKAGILGGVILIAIGIEIFLTGIL